MYTFFPTYFQFRLSRFRQQEDKTGSGGRESQVLFCLLKKKNKKKNLLIHILFLTRNYDNLILHKISSWLLAGTEYTEQINSQESPGMLFLSTWDMTVMNHLHFLMSWWDPWSKCVGMASLMEPSNHQSKPECPVSVLTGDVCNIV